METSSWAKTLVGVYRYLSTISNSIDDMVKKDAHSAIYNYRPNSTFDIASRIMELNNRKVKIINLKILTEEMVAKLNKLDLNIITLNLFEGIKSSEVCNILNLSMRTFFRRKKNAIDSLSKILFNMGYDDEKIMKLYGDENWLVNAHKLDLEEQENCQESQKKYESILLRGKDARLAYAY